MKSSCSISRLGFSACIERRAFCLTLWCLQAVALNDLLFHHVCDCGRALQMAPSLGSRPRPPKGKPANLGGFPTRSFAVVAMSPEHFGQLPSKVELPKVKPSTCTEAGLTASKTTWHTILGRSPKYQHTRRESNCTQFTPYNTAMPI